MPDSDAYDINDAKAVQALLNQLGASQAWKTVVNEPKPGPPNTASLAQSRGAQGVHDTEPEAGADRQSVASLLSQLQSQASTPEPWRSHDPGAPKEPPMTDDAGPPSINPNSQGGITSFTPGYRQQSVTNGDLNLRHCTFQQALPILSELVNRKELVDALKSMKMEQDSLERRLLEERNAITRKYEEKIKVATTKATLIGSGISKHEATMLNDNYKKEVAKFDRERVIPAWDGLVAQQQEALFSFGVPTMFPASATTDREKQQKVIQVLEALTSNTKWTNDAVGALLELSSTAITNDGPTEVLHVFRSPGSPLSGRRAFTMPYVDLYSEDDWTSIFYTTNSAFGNVSGFDPEKPTIMMLHPAFLDSSWLDNQFGDPRLDNNFNLIAFDMRVCGKSSCRPSGRHDSWVDAADLAFCHQSLHLPPCHVLALETLSVSAALRFAVLFPEMCLSLTLCNVPPPTELKWVFNAFDEVMQSWCYADDLESFEHVCMEAVKFMVGPSCDPDLLDDLIGYWEVMMPPRRRRRMVELMNIVMNRMPLKADVLKEIRQPVLIIHGERNETCPMKYAERLQSELVNAEGGAILYTVKGGAGALNVVSGTATITNQVFAKFLSRLPHCRSDLKKPSISKGERMAVALGRLAELTGDSSITSRDPSSSLSFSCLPADVARGQSDSLALYKRGEIDAFDPTGPDGRPIRKYSEKKDEHWFQGEKDGISYASTTLAKLGKQGSELHERHLSMLVSDNNGDLASQGRLRRPTISPNTIEKPAIKGSMAKVVGSNTSASFQRILK
uniref:Putative alpha/beta-hydrolase n=1 Tax=Moniliophthora roreri TaxID=221103 RepID=A0A0W0G494_MONRR